MSSNRRQLTATGTSATLDVNGQERVRPERARRGRVEKVWRCVRWAEAYPDESLNMNAVDLTPTFALRKLAVLFDGGKVAECAALVRRLSAITLESILSQLPVDILHDALPSSLPVLEAIYIKVAQNSPGQLPTDTLRTDQLIQQLVALFAKHSPHRGSPAGHVISPPHSPPPPPPPPPPHAGSAGDGKACNLHIPCCRSILRVVMDAEPNFRRTVAQRKRTLDKCLRRMGKHGLVGGSDGKSLVSLHEALRVEFERQVALYRGALQKLEQLNLTSSKHNNVEKSVTGLPAPTEASHQRLMQVSRSDVQERVIKNKTLLTTIEPAVRSADLQRLLRTLRARVESDKLLLFHHTELRKLAAAASTSSFSTSSSSSTLSRLAVVAQSSSSSPSGSAESNGLSSETQQIAATLLRFSQGYTALLRLAREVVEAQRGDDVTDMDDALSDDSSGDEDGVERGGLGEEGLGGDYLSVTSTLSIMKKMKVINLNGILPLQPATVIAATSSGRLRTRNGWLPNQSVHHHHQQTTLQGSRGHRHQREAGLQTTPTMEDGGTSREPTNVSPPPATHHHHHNTGWKGQAQTTNLQTQSTAVTAAEENLPADSRIAPYAYGGNVITAVPNSANVAMLEQEVLYLRQELASARDQIRTLQDHEKQLRDRLVGQAHQQFQMGGCPRNAAGGPLFEDLSLGSQRPAELIRRYGELYLDSRVEALDALDRLAPLHGLDMLKLKILFSVVVLSFKATQQHVGELRGRLRHLLGLPVPSATGTEHTPHPSTQSGPLYRHAGGSGRHHQVSGTEGNSSTSATAAMTMPTASESASQAAAVQMEHHITAYLCKTANTFEVAEIVFEVCQQIYATLYDYPCLKACPGLLQYVSQCVRVAWGLSVQQWAYTISYDAQTFQEGFHARFHTSDPAATEIRSYLWPGLVDSQGVCVSRAVVMT